MIFLPSQPRASDVHYGNKIMYTCIDQEQYHLLDIKELYHHMSFSEEWVLYLWYFMYNLLIIPLHLFQKWSFSKINFKESFHLNLLIFTLIKLLGIFIVPSKQKHTYSARSEDTGSLQMGIHTRTTTHTQKVERINIQLISFHSFVSENQNSD